MELRTSIATNRILSTDVAIHALSQLSFDFVRASAARTYPRVICLREAIARHEPIDQFEHAIDFTAINYSKGERSAIGQYAPRY